MTVEERRVKNAAAAKRRYDALTPEQKHARNTSPAARAAKARARTKPETQAKDKAYCAEWWTKNKEWKGFVRRLSTYGLTLDQYHAMAEGQNFLCAICLEEPNVKAKNASNDNFVIDHNHDTDQVRGLLCSNCNSAFGLLAENPNRMRRMAFYAEEKAA